MAFFTINSVAIKNPTTFKIERFNVTNLERLADATMAGDLIAKKLKFYFTYEAISSYDLDVLLEAIWVSSNLFFTLGYVDNGIEKTAQVYVGAIPAELHQAGLTTNWVWKGITFNLIQQ